MSVIPNLLQRAVSLLLRLLLAVMAAIFALSLLVAGVGVVVFAVLRALVTGRRPVLWDTWRSVRAQHGRWRTRATPTEVPARAAGRRPAPDDVTDVEARDIPRS